MATILVKDQNHLGAYGEPWGQPRPGGCQLRSQWREEAWVTEQLYSSKLSPSSAEAGLCLVLVAPSPALSWRPQMNEVPVKMHSKVCHVLT